ncbi:MAG: type II secretion system F family protein [Anaerolineae bacterium]|nr:type II secretion system F family protein [Anaerolineae bacterium]
MIPLLISSAVLAFFVGIYRLSSTEAKIEARLESVPATFTPRRMPRDERRVRDGKLRGFWSLVLRPLSAYTKRVEIELTRANLKLTATEYMLFSAGLISVSFLVGMAFTRQVIPGLALAALATQVPRFYLRRLQNQRLKAFQEQLPDVLNLLVSSLRAGYGLLHAMEVVAQEMPNPSAEEFSKVVRETALGFSLPEALAHLVRRVDSDDLELIATAIAVQHEVGGNLAEILETIGNTIRERVRIKGEISVMTTQQRITGYVLSAMPFILGVILLVINPDYMMTIFQPRWIFIPGIALGMMILGNWMIRRILNQELA